MHTHLRIARPVSDLARSVAQYTQGLGIVQLGSFKDHAGFDGAMLGSPGAGFHWEFTHCTSHPVAPAPTPKDLLVFYVPEQEAWQARCDAMLTAGFAEVQSLNPYWAQSGRSFEDPDGYRVVIQCAAWDGGSATQRVPPLAGAATTSSARKAASPNPADTHSAPTPSRSRHRPNSHGDAA
jgi:catechol 2,3-dioxygenase-like lactoylglutathione lyase family enzyme